jgi:long-chain acyl-CoA synthetase
VKLQHGEYVSLNKVESVIKICPFVENICIYGDSTKQFVVALITPNIEQLRAMVYKLKSNTYYFSVISLLKK